MNEARANLLEATYRCIARDGLHGTTVDAAAREAGVSRATVYRWFQGGREQLLNETIAWQTDRFFEDLAVEVAGSATFEEVVTRALVSAHQWVVGHEVLQRLLDTEAGQLLPPIVEEMRKLVPAIGRFVEPYLVAEGVTDPAAKGEYVARIVVSMLGSPGRWDLDDPAQVAELVRTEIVAGVLA
ncbi:MAG: transcriptional regulator, TetR family [Actinomycetia bacterium]|nr:transcriptional regulator, TetR family [Actinomycetes bacterium]